MGSCRPEASCCADAPWSETAGVAEEVSEYVSVGVVSWTPATSCDCVSSESAAPADPVGSEVAPASSVGVSCPTPPAEVAGSAPGWWQIVTRVCPSPVWTGAPEVGPSTVSPSAAWVTPANATMARAANAAPASRAALPADPRAAWAPAVLEACDRRTCFDIRSSPPAFEGPGRGSRPPAGRGVSLLHRSTLTAPRQNVAGLARNPSGRGSARDVRVIRLVAGTDYASASSLTSSRGTSAVLVVGCDARPCRSNF